MIESFLIFFFLVGYTVCTMTPMSLGNCVWIRIRMTRIAKVIVARINVFTAGPVVGGILF